MRSISEVEEQNNFHRFKVFYKRKASIVVRETRNIIRDEMFHVPSPASVVTYQGDDARSIAPTVSDVPVTESVALSQDALEAHSYCLPPMQYDISKDNLIQFEVATHQVLHFFGIVERKNLSRRANGTQTD